MTPTGNTDASPPLWDTTAEPSAFDPDDWFRYYEEVNGRPPPRLPVLGVQSVMPAHLDIAVRRYGAEVDDSRWPTIQSRRSHSQAFPSSSGCPPKDHAPQAGSTR